MQVLRVLTISCPTLFATALVVPIGIPGAMDNDAGAFQSWDACQLCNICLRLAIQSAICVAIALSNRAITSRPLKMLSAFCAGQAHQINSPTPRGWRFRVVVPDLLVLTY